MTEHRRFAIRNRDSNPGTWRPGETNFQMRETSAPDVRAATLSTFITPFEATSPPRAGALPRHLSPSTRRRQLPLSDPLAHSSREPAQVSIELGARARGVRNSRGPAPKWLLRFAVHATSVCESNSFRNLSATRTSSSETSTRFPIMLDRPLTSGSWFPKL